MFPVRITGPINELIFLIRAKSASRDGNCSLMIWPNATFCAVAKVMPWSCPSAAALETS